MKILRNLPAVHQLKEHQHYISILATYPIADHVLTKWLGEQVDEIRGLVKNNPLKYEAFDKEKFTESIFKLLDTKIQLFSNNNLRRVVNVTGVVLHTNLGRARLSEQAIDHIADIASSYSTLEYEVVTGLRGSRHSIVEDYLTGLTGAEAAMVVNNNAAAVYLVLKAIAAEKQAIVSRGELVEIGGSFRVSEIMKESQVELVEIGTTNKTNLTDYERAITEDTALLMKVHKSNFKIIGFTDEVHTAQLVNLSKKHGIPIYEDLGSGTLFNFRAKRIGEEPTVKEQVDAGIDIISFSGDKLLGGPQAGIIIGKKKYIDKMKEHQLARVLRVDKFTLAGLEATLKSYVRGQEQYEIPTVRDIIELSETVLEKVDYFIKKVTEEAPSFIYEMKDDTSKVGGGTMPTVEIDSCVVHVTHHTLSSEKIAALLRHYDVPIIVRVKRESVLLDFRTVDYEELEIVIQAFLQMQKK